ncbi:MAG: methyltransferase domain-containing protein [Chloroherpetonaceae bacterium]|nr:methyltransferase domain-containing protein [Chloroherpetonaceae bacterium]
MNLDHNPKSGSLFGVSASDYDKLSELRPEFLERFSIWEKHISLTFPNQRNLKALDLGCGNGYITLTLAKLGYQVVSIDGDQEMLKLTRNKLENEKLIGSVSLGHYFLPLPDQFVTEHENHFDLIVLSSVIEYIEKSDQLLKQCQLLLKPDGYLMISFPNKKSIYRLLERLLKNTPIFKNSYVRFQKKQYDLSDINFISISNNFTIEFTKYYALPFQRYLKYFTKSNSIDWLSTLILVKFKKK